MAMITPRLITAPIINGSNTPRAPAELPSRNGVSSKILVI